MNIRRDTGIVEFAEDGIRVDAMIIAEGLGLEAESVRDKIRQGTLTSACEKGVGADYGRHRLTFFQDQREFRIIVNSSGDVLQRFRTDYGEVISRRMKALCP